ncbi:Bromodomain Adjacent To Zinc Finger Domain Protein 1A, partial [Manis pentadactyla]
MALLYRLPSPLHSTWGDGINICPGLVTGEPLVSQKHPTHDSGLQDMASQLPLTWFS